MKRGGSLARRIPLARAPFRRKGVKRRLSAYKRRERFVDYMLWVKTQPCVVTTMGVFVTQASTSARASALANCAGEVQADHAGPRAMGRKAHDSTCIPLCAAHHDQRTNGWGLFRDYTLDMKRAWKANAIAHTQARSRTLGVVVPVQT